MLPTDVLDIVASYAGYKNMVDAIIPLHLHSPSDDWFPVIQRYARKELKRKYDFAFDDYPNI